MTEETQQVLDGNQQVEDTSTSTPSSEGSPSIHEQKTHANTVPLQSHIKLRNERNELRRKLQEIEQKQQEVSLVEPKETDYEYDDEKYQQAKARYDREKLKRELKDEFRAEQAQQTEQQRYQQSLNQFEIQLDQYAASNPDLDQAIAENQDINMQSFAPAILGIEGKDKDGIPLGPKVYHHIYRNRELALRLQRMNPIQAATEIGVLTARLSGSTQKQEVSKAPNPMTPVQGGTGIVTEDPLKTESVEDYVRIRMKQLNG